MFFHLSCRYYQTIGSGRNEGMGTAVGLDIGYTNVRGALLDDRGRVLRRARLPADASRTAQALLVP